jgi:hypothetical protein
MEGVFVAKRSEVINIIGTHVMCIPILTFFNRNLSVGVRRTGYDRCCAAHRVVMICSIKDELFLKVECHADGAMV